MRIVMFTNTYLPHVGGVARSVSTTEQELCRRGHDVRVVAPEFEGGEASSGRVLRTPAIQNFNGSDFSVQIPQPGLLADFVDDFRPDILHSHHPFLLGDSALRLAWSRRLPLVFTYHTMYEQYTHYVPLNSDALKRFVIQMSSEYCNLCAQVIAPSESVAGLLRQRGITTPITSIPTGIDVEFYGSGDRIAFRRRVGIHSSAVVVGHVGRLAAEKNLHYLAEAVGCYLAENSDAAFLVVGTGDAQESIKQIVNELARPEQLVMAGCQTGQDLADAYAAMDIFAFSSQSETQGMVLAEAMAAGVPAVALDAPGAREIVSDRNGRLLPSDSSAEVFAQTLAEFTRDADRLRQLGRNARNSAQEFGLNRCAARLLGVYHQLVDNYARGPAADPGPWDKLLGRLEIEWNLIVEKTSALAAAARETDATKRQLE